MVHSLFQLFTWMGSEWVLGILGFLSILTLTVALERFQELRKMAQTSSRFWSEHVDAWFLRAEPEAWKGEIENLQASYPCLETDMLRLIDRAQANGDKNLASLVDAYLGQRKMKLERYISILGTIGANAPFVGLLGTVLGIIRAFHEISAHGLGNGMESVMGGIAEALVATAVGLMVAMPAVIFFNVLSKRVSQLVRRAESVGQFVLARGSK